jgi:hypothetical protein
MFRVRFRLFDSHDGRDVFQEVNAALLTGAAMALFVPAGRALIPQRCMASLAKTGDIANVGAAFRTLHTVILALCDEACPITQAACNDSDNLSNWPGRRLRDFDDFF